MSSYTTTISDLINPEVMADMISGKIEKKIVVSPFAKVDNTLVGIPGNTITVPQYSYIGDAAEIAEGVSAETAKLQTSSVTVTVKKAMKAVELTDEAILSGYGNPVAETNNQLAKAIASKVDADAMDALYNAQLQFDGSGAKIAYTGIVDAIDLFEEEVNTEKVMFVHPNQVSTLRKDNNFTSTDKYQAGVMVSGEIGKVANCRIVPSKRVVLNNSWYKFTTSGTANAKHIVASGASSGEVNLSAVLPTLPTAAVGDYVLLVETPCYFNPIVKLSGDAETEEESAALTIYLKRDTNVETERDSLARKTDISVDKHFAVALTNTAKVVLAKIKA